MKNNQQPEQNNKRNTQYMHLLNVLIRTSQNSLKLFNKSFKAEYKRIQETLEPSMERAQEVGKIIDKFKLPHYDEIPEVNEAFKTSDPTPILKLIEEELEIARGDGYSRVFPMGIYFAKQKEAMAWWKGIEILAKAFSVKFPDGRYDKTIKIINNSGQCLRKEWAKYLSEYKRGRKPKNIDIKLLKKEHKKLLKTLESFLVEKYPQYVTRRRVPTGEYYSIRKFGKDQKLTKSLAHFNSEYKLISDDELIKFNKHDPDKIRTTKQITDVILSIRYECNPGHINNLLFR